ncbi:hypothetical protein QUF74_07170 [Candidatus Halobeggiatoa sp. HSG11]|nr:hypothetical protein [Candidatus Halobeggiatoa sp. HSG11]
MKLFKILLLFPLCFSINVEAKDAMPDPDCIKSEHECQMIANRKEAVRQRCIADPEWCKERRYQKRLRMEERREVKRQCKANPEQCDELTRAFKKRQHQIRKEARANLELEKEQWCKDNPDACKQWEAESKKIREQCQALKYQLKEKFPDRPRKM